MAICFGIQNGDPYLTVGANGTRHEFLKEDYAWDYFVDTENLEVIYKGKALLNKGKCYRQSFTVTADAITFETPKEIECTSYELFYGA